MSTDDAALDVVGVGVGIAEVVEAFVAVGFPLELSPGAIVAVSVGAGSEDTETEDAGSVDVDAVDVETGDTGAAGSVPVGVVLTVVDGVELWTLETESGGGATGTAVTVGFVVLSGADGATTGREVTGDVLVVADPVVLTAEALLEVSVRTEVAAGTGTETFRVPVSFARDSATSIRLTSTHKEFRSACSFS